jgi:histidine kinase
MSGMMGPNGPALSEGEGMMGMMNGEQDDLFANFRAAFNETLLLAALASVLAAAAASFLIAGRIVAPVWAMTAASRRIAAGSYSERVPVQTQTGQEDELGQLAVSFNTMAAQLEQTETMRRRLIGDVAHELRTPLTTIKGSMEGLIDGVLTGDAATYQQLYREADRLGRLVDDLQELSRVESGAFALERRSIKVEELVRGVAARMQTQYAEKGVSLLDDCSTNLPAVMADEDRLTQVLTNLLGNALQYTPEGGAVRLRCAQVDRGFLAGRFADLEETDPGSGKWMLVSVQDNGIGIAPEHLQHVFDRFYRVDKSRSRSGGGSGIGLTIARRLVEAHGGRIWAESGGIGKGSTFTFCLPGGGSGDGAAGP